MKLIALLSLVMLMAGCASITGSNFYTYNVYIIAGPQARVEGVDTRIVPVDKSSQGAVTSAQTVTPTANVTVPIIP